MKKQFFLFFIFSITILPTFAQSKRANIWYQNYGMGLDFNCTPPCSVSSSLHECWSSSTICDKDGNLQFYTNNQTIWNSNHQVMENGTDLYACPWSDQGSVIVPLTSNPYQYYLVTCDEFRYPLNQQYTPPSVCLDVNPVKKVISLHLIDVGANDGKGTVLWKNKVIYEGANLNAMLAAIKHVNTKDTWLMTYDYDTNRFISLLLTDCGIQDTVISPDFGNHIYGSGHIITFSPKGDLMHVRDENVMNHEGSMVANFNTTTGELSAPLFLKTDTWGACFSTDSRYLYTLNNYAKIPRYDLSLKDTAAMYANILYTPTDPREGYNLGVQNGPDGKIYFNFNYNYLTWYICDNISGSTPTLTKRFTPASNSNSIIVYTTITNFVQSWFDPDFKEYEYGSPFISYQRVCTGNKTTLVAHGIPPVTPWHWEVQDNNLPVSYYYNEDTITHLFSSSGFHTVNLVIDFSCIPDVITKNDILVDGYPLPNYMKDTAVCEGSTATVSAEPDMVSYQWNTGSSTPQESAMVDNTYIVEVSNTCGSTTDSVTLTKIEYNVTNLVTQNQDGMNETLNIKSNTLAPGQLEIYNNWGSRIYLNKSYENTWPEKEEEAGVYFYRYALSTCKATKGWVQVTH